jgi:hypothetical protein
MVTWASQDPETCTWRCSPPMPEVLIKVSLAYSYPGFFRTGNSNVPIEVMVFIFYSDEITIDVKTGLVTRHKN